MQFRRGGNRARHNLNGTNKENAHQLIAAMNNHGGGPSKGSYLGRRPHGTTRTRSRDLAPFIERLQRSINTERGIPD
eukprot:1064882-Pyramimonas_sp.AAC.1